MLNNFRRWFKLSEGIQSYPGHMLVLVLRGAFGAFIIAIATGLLFLLIDQYQMTLLGLLAFFLTLALGIAVVALDAMAKDKQITTVSAIGFGLLLGFLFSRLFAQALTPILREYLDSRLFNRLFP